MHVVSISLNEQSILRPVSFAIVSESPLLGEFLFWLDHEPVAEVLLHESSTVDYFLLTLLLFFLGVLRLSHLTLTLILR